MSSIGSFIQTIHQVLSDPALQLFVSTSLSGASIILAQRSSNQNQGSILKKVSLFNHISLSIYQRLL